MHTAEKFYRPGLEDPSDVIASLPEVPRTLHLVGKQLSIIWRSLACIISLSCGALIEYTLVKSFIDDASQMSLLLAAVALPIFFIFIPWWLIASYKKRIKSYTYCKRVYENGTACIGMVNTLTKITGRDMETYKFDSFHPHRHGHIRVDYTFEVDNLIKVGTVVLSTSSARYLNVNDKICVLYLPDNTTENMLFPIPGNEFLEIIK